MPPTHSTTTKTTTATTATTTTTTTTFFSKNLLRSRNFYCNRLASINYIIHIVVVVRLPVGEGKLQINSLTLVLSYSSKNHIELLSYSLV